MERQQRADAFRKMTNGKMVKARNLKVGMKIDYGGIHTVTDVEDNGDGMTIGFNHDSGTDFDYNDMFEVQ